PGRHRLHGAGRARATVEAALAHPAAREQTVGSGTGADRRSEAAQHGLGAARARQFPLNRWWATSPRRAIRDADRVVIHTVLWDQRVRKHLATPRRMC